MNHRSTEQPVYEDERLPPVVEPRQWPPAGWEWAVAVLGSVASMVLVAWLARDLWFFADAWDFVAFRDLNSLDSLLEPHGGHWSTPTVVLNRVLYSLAGLDYWPWHYIPRLIAYGGLCLVCWHTIRWRGADPTIALGVLGVLLVFGSSGWHNAATVGNPIALSASLVVARVLQDHDRPGPRERLLVGGLLALASAGLGVAILSGTSLAVLLARRLGRWWPSLAGAWAVYGIWYLSYNRGGSTTVDRSTNTLLEAPSVALEVIEAGLERTLQTPATWGATLSIAVGAAIVFLAARRRLGLFEGVFLATALAYLAMVVLTRIAAGQAQINAIRYGYNLTFLLVPVLIPQIRVHGNRALRWGLLGLIIAVGAGNVRQLDISTNFWEVRSQASRQVVETTAALIAAGEPADPTSAVDFRAGMLRVSGVQRLVADGWTPDGSDNPELQASARGQLRMRILPTANIRPGGVLTDVPIEDGCAVVPPDATLTTRVVDATTLRVEGPRNSIVRLLWLDDFGPGERLIEFTDALSTGRAFVSIVNPDAGAELTVVAPPQGRTTVCGLALS